MQKMLDASVDAKFKDGDNPEDSKAGFIEWSRQYTKADAFIIILEDRESRHPTYESHDCPIAAGFILLAAEALGYGATYLTDTLNPEGCKAALGIPARYSPFCAIAVGVPEERPTAPKKPSIEEVVWNESIGVPFQSIN
jgi:nitroreductase